MNGTIELCTIGFIAQRWQVSYESLASKLAERGFKPVVKLNEQAWFDAGEIERAACEVRCKCNLDDLNNSGMIHGAASGPVEITEPSDGLLTLLRSRQSYNALKN